MDEHKTTYAAYVAMFELSRIKPRQHVIESIAVKVLEAARVGATVLDDDLDYEAMAKAWGRGHSDGFFGALRDIVRTGAGVDDE